MRILFTTIQSPYSSEFEVLIQQIRSQSSSHEISLVLLQDAVLAAHPAKKNPLSQEDSKNFKVYALQEDLAARGLAKGHLFKQVQVVTSADVIELVMEKCDKLVSWS